MHACHEGERFGEIGKFELAFDRIAVAAQAPLGQCAQQLLRSSSLSCSTVMGSRSPLACRSRAFAYRSAHATSPVAKDLACRRGELLFRGLSFACAPGDALLVAGANGTGKSSLIRMLAGLPGHSGMVASEGAIGLVDDRLALDPNLPLGRALRFWERLDDCAAPTHAHEILQLEPLLDVPVRYLSTGQKKRAALARLLNRSCPIWLLDEPLNGLDTQAQASFEALIAGGDGGIALVASHQGIALPDPARVELAEYAV